MAEYEEAGYYDVQLNNKQLVFFFMAAVAIAVVVFLCGVMVGRGVHDATMSTVSNSFTPISELSPAPEKGVTPTEVRSELDYQQRLESKGVDDRLEGGGGSTSPESLAAKAPPRDSGSQSAAAKPPATKPKPAAPPKKAPASVASAPSKKLLGSAQGAFTIQVVALKTRDTAEKLVDRLQGKTYRAYLESGGATGLYRVRVGRFANRGEVTRNLSDSPRVDPYDRQAHQGPPGPCCDPPCRTASPAH